MVSSIGRLGTSSLAPASSEATAKPTTLCSPRGVPGGASATSPPRRLNTGEVLADAVRGRAVLAVPGRGDGGGGALGVIAAATSLSTLAT